MTKPAEYTSVIDQLVEICQSGQGRVGAQKATRGVWNPNQHALLTAEHRSANELLAKLTDPEREVLANLLHSEFVAGVFETLKTLEVHRLAPFESGYEGEPAQDFIGRLNGWSWPELLA